MFECVTCDWTWKNKLLLGRAGVLLLCGLALGLGEVIALIRENCFGKIQVSNLTSDRLIYLEYGWLVFCVPIFSVYVVTLLIWPPWVRTEFPVRPWLNESTTEQGEAAWKLHLRIVTRGNNPSLVATSCCDLQKVLDSINLPKALYVIEVVTDARVGFQKWSEVELDEVVVPTQYRCKNGAKWKARALQFALEAVTAPSDDWIVHLDEETRVDERCITAIWAHILQERKVVANGEKMYPDLGQGAMLYGAGKHGKIENWSTTLADSLRVCDDFGSFRCAFEMRNKVTFGMKGSFVVANQRVEELVVWDHSPLLSLTEDATFNLVALKEFRIGTAWIDAFMYEQSPFSMKDFAKQRSRWYVGLWLCMMSEKTRSRYMWVMPIKMCFWTSQLLVIFLHLSALATDVMPVHTEMVLFIYMCGFSITFTPQDGVLRWIGLGCLQILFIPFFLYMEFMGVLGGVREIASLNYGTNFHIVQKETAHAIASWQNKLVEDIKVPLLAVETASSQPLVADTHLVKVAKDNGHYRSSSSSSSNSSSSSDLLIKQRSSSSSSSNVVSDEPAKGGLDLDTENIRVHAANAIPNLPLIADTDAVSMQEDKGLCRSSSRSNSSSSLSEVLIDQHSSSSNSSNAVFTQPLKNGMQPDTPKDERRCRSSSASNSSSTSCDLLIKHRSSSSNSSNTVSQETLKDGTDADTHRSSSSNSSSNTVSIEPVQSYTDLATNDKHAHTVAPYTKQAQVHSADEISRQPLVAPVEAGTKQHMVKHKGAKYIASVHQEVVDTNKVPVRVVYASSNQKQASAQNVTFSPVAFAPHTILSPRPLRVDANVGMPGNVLQKESITHHSAPCNRTLANTLQAPLLASEAASNE